MGENILIGAAKLRADRGIGARFAEGAFNAAHTTLSALWVGLISGIAQPQSLLVSLVTLKCVEALFLSWESKADGDGFGATFASGPCQYKCSASASGDRIAANASAGAI